MATPFAFRFSSADVVTIRHPDFKLRCRAPRLRGCGKAGPIGMDASPKVQQRADIVAALADYILAHHPSKFTAQTLPHDESLLEAGVLDSAGVIEFIVHVESTWGIEI